MDTEGNGLLLANMMLVVTKKQTATNRACLKFIIKINFYIRRFKKRLSDIQKEI